MDGSYRIRIVGYVIPLDSLASTVAFLMPLTLRFEMLDEAMVGPLPRKTPAQRLAISNGMWRSARRMIEAMLFPAELMAKMQAAADNAAKGIRDPEAMRKACEEMDRMRRLALELAWRSFLLLRDPAALPGRRGHPTDLLFGENRTARNKRIRPLHRLRRQQPQLFEFPPAFVPFAGAGQAFPRIILHCQEVFGAPEAPGLGEA